MAFQKTSGWQNLFDGFSTGFPSIIQERDMLQTYYPYKKILLVILRRMVYNLTLLDVY